MEKWKKENPGKEENKKIKKAKKETKKEIADLTVGKEVLTQISTKKNVCDFVELKSITPINLKHKRRTSLEHVSGYVFFLFLINDKNHLKNDSYNGQ